MPLEIKKCDKCGNRFQPKTGNQRFCQNPCSMGTRRSIADQNKYWMERPKKKARNNKRVDLVFKKDSEMPCFYF